MKLNNEAIKIIKSPIVVIIFVLSLLLVFFRMKSIDLDLKLTGINQDISRSINLNKDLKVKKANLLNTTNLNLLAKKYKMYSPGQSQVIVIKND